jgi:glycopeptide antibiotics resistance protein
MDIAEVMGSLLKWSVPALLAMAAGMGVVLFVYIVIYRRVFNGEKRITAKTFILLVLLIGYLFLVFALTNLGRGANYDGWINLNILSGYIDAWNDWSLLAFQLIVFNVILFIPLGILLPLLSRKLDSLKAVCLIALGFTLFIEFFQLLTHTGIFELDDILHNTLGGVLGLLVFRAFKELIQNRRVRFKTVMKAVMIPAAFTFLFLGAQIFYGIQEFGNLSEYPSRGTDLTGVTISSVIPLRTEEKEASVFLNVRSNMPERGDEIADVLHTELGLPDIRSDARDGDNRQYRFMEEDGTAYCMTYFNREGTWSLFDNNFDYNQPKAQAGVAASQIEETLKQNGFLPDYASLTADRNGMLRWDANVENPIEIKEDFLSGVVMAQILPEGKIVSLSCDLTENKYIRQVKLISRQEAFQRIRQGKFDSYTPFHRGDNLVITNCRIVYRYDSKGYYQPEYLFTGMLNGEPDASSILIPALKT